MATLVTITITINTPLTNSQAVAKVADVMRVFQGNTVNPIYADEAVTLVVT
jgi:hypothetical protein